MVYCPRFISAEAAAPLKLRAAEAYSANERVIFSTRPLENDPELGLAQAIDRENLRAPGFETKDGVGAGTDFDAGKQVEWDPEVVREDRFDGVAVSEESDSLVRIFALNFLQECDHSALGLKHRLAIGNARAAAVEIEVLPSRVSIQIVDRFSGPVAEVDFVDLGRDLDLKAEAPGGGFGRLARAFEGAAENPLDADSRKIARDAFSLGPALIVEVNIRKARGQESFCQVIVCAVANEIEGGHVIKSKTRRPGNLRYML